MTDGTVTESADPRLEIGPRRGSAPAGIARLRRGSYPYLLVSPVVVLVGLGILYPIGYLLWLSLHDYSPFYRRTMVFAGLENYLKMLGDSVVWRALEASGIWVVGSVVPQFLLGLGMALLLNERFRGNGAVRSLILLPWVVSGVITGIIWNWLFDGTVGVISDLLMKLGVIALPVPWAVRPETAWMMALVANAWRGAPFFAIMLLAALQSISGDLYEAAKVDGAGRWERFRFITLPLIMNAVIVSTMLRAIWTFNYVDLIWTMTHGGPTNATRTLAIHVLNTTYVDGDFGYAASISVSVVLLLVVFSAVYWRLNRLGYRPD